MKKLHPTLIYPPPPLCNTGTSVMRHPSLWISLLINSESRVSREWTEADLCCGHCDFVTLVVTCDFLSCLLLGL